MSARAAADHELVDTYVDALLARDRRRAIALATDALAAGGSVSDLACDLLAVAQRRIGDAWQRNDVTIADEHVATAISETVLEQLVASAPAPAPRGDPYLVACPDGEQHTFAARLAAAVLRDRGIDVVFAGPSLPASHLERLIADVRPTWVGFSTSLSARLPALRSAVALARERMPQVRIAVGGRVARDHPQFLRNVAPDLTVDDARDAADAVAAA